MPDHKVESFRSKAARTGRVLLVGPLGPAAPWERFTTHEWARLGVDGGALQAPPDGFDLTVGDGDSGQAPLDVRWPIHKDATDLELTLGLLPAGVATTLWGFWGGRMDHQMAVWGALHARCALDGMAFDVEGPQGDHLTVRPSGEHAFSAAGLFSLWSLVPARFTIRGACRYLLEAPTLCAPLSGHTLSNHAHGAFSVGSDAPFFLYRQARP